MALTMRVEYDLTAEDFTALALWTRQHLPGARARFWSYLAAWTVLLFLVGFSIFSAVRGDWPESSIFWAIGVLTLGAWLLLRDWWNWKNAGATAFAEARSSNMTTGLVLAVLPEGLRQSTPVTDQVVKWSQIRQLDGSEALLVIVLEDASVLFVPRRAFPDESAFQTFADTIRVPFTENATGNSSP